MEESIATAWGKTKLVIDRSLLERKAWWEHSNQFSFFVCVILKLQNWKSHEKSQARGDV